MPLSMFYHCRDSLGLISFTRNDIVWLGFVDNKLIGLQRIAGTLRCSIKMALIHKIIREYLLGGTYS